MVGNNDFYNVHYYDWMYNPTYGYDPMRADAVTHWLLDKPTVVAECTPYSAHYSSKDMLTISTNHSFEGVLFWAYNDPKMKPQNAIGPLKAFAEQEKTSYAAVMSWLAAPTPPPVPPPCTDISPGGGTCVEQKSWGKCTAKFMAGFCCRTCFACDPKCGH